MRRASGYSWRLVALAGIAVAILGLGVAFDLIRRSVVQPGYQGTSLDGVIAPGFRLVNQHGLPRALSGYRGRAVLLTFMDGHCKNLCPTTLKTMAAIQRRLGSAAGRLAIVAVSADPWLDQVGKPAAIATEPGSVAPVSWDFLTGTQAELQPIWDAYHVGVEEQIVGAFSANAGHDTGFFLIDASGRERLYIESDSPLSVLMRQVRNVIGRG